MSITTFITRVCVQPAVYWGNPVEDGYGGKVFDTPVEIKVRWEEKQRLMAAHNGKEVISKASILSPTDLVVEGYIYLGTLAEESSANPKEVDGAFEIIAVDKTPLFRSTDKFVRTYYLGFKNLY